MIADFPKEYFDVQYSTDNGTYHIVQTLKKGFPVIDGTLKSIILPVSWSKGTDQWEVEGMSGVREGGREREREMGWGSGLGEGEKVN